MAALDKIIPMPKKIILISLLCGAILLFSGIFFLIKSYRSIVVKPNIPQTVSPTATPTPDPLRPISILLLGYGGGKHEGGRLSDSMMVVRIEPRNRQIRLVSIPRDIWVPLPLSVGETKYYKINAAYAIGGDDKNYPNKPVEFTGTAGGGQMAKYAAGQIVGFNIDYFVALNFNGFIKIIDILGGVPINVAQTFDDPLYPIEKDEIDNCGKTEEEIAALTATLSGTKLEEQFSCRYEVLHFDKGLQTMNGTTALKFVRSRHSPQDGGDFNRAARQRLLLLAVKDRVINLGFIPKIIPTIQTLSGNLQTDIDLTRLQEFIDQINEYDQYEIISIPLTDQNVLVNSRSSDGQFILVPKDDPNNWSLVHQFIEIPTLLTPTTLPVQN